MGTATVTATATATTMIEAAGMATGETVGAMMEGVIGVVTTNRDDKQKCRRMQKRGLSLRRMVLRGR